MINLNYNNILMEFLMKKIFRKRTQIIGCTIIMAIITLSLGFYGLFTFERNNILKVELVHMEFNSNRNDLQNKNINYKVFIKNNSDKQIKYRLIFIRKDNEKYPYLDSIPKEYKSEVLYIGEGKSEFLELKTVYVSSQNKNTGGFYNNFNIEIQYQE